MPLRKKPESSSCVEINSAMRRHLVATYVNVCHLLRQMEEAAAEGRSPTGVGSPLTPLPPERTDPVLAPLRTLKARLREAATELAPAELHAFDQSQPDHNTVVWLSNLLDRIREAVDGLAPSRMRKYGRMAEEPRARYGARHEALCALVRDAREALDDGDRSDAD